MLQVYSRPHCLSPKWWYGLALVAGVTITVFYVAGVAHGDHQPNKLVVTILDTPDPAPGLSNLIYEIRVKNDGRTKATKVKVELALADGVQFVKCSTSLDKGIQLCQQAGPSTVLAQLGTIKAHKTAKIFLTIKTPPAGITSSEIKFTAKATGENAHKGNDSERTILLPPRATALLLPSLRSEIIECGMVLGRQFFGTDTTVQLTESMGCPGMGVGVVINASGVTLELNGQKIVGESVAGNVGVRVVAGATDVTIDGGGTNGTNGIEYFDWCIRDEGGSTNLLLKNLRCYRARSAALAIVSSQVQISKVKIDATAPVKGATAELPGGVGIHARGDNIRIKDTIVRRSEICGIWADGTDTDGNGRVVTIDGNVRTMKVENNFGIGILLEQGPHIVKDAAIAGDGPDKGRSTDGVVVASGVGNILDSVVVKRHRGNGIVIMENATASVIERVNTEDIALDGFVSLGRGSFLNGNSAKARRDGFVVVGPENVLTSNRAEAAGKNGFVVTGVEAVLSGNSAKANSLHGYLVDGDNGNLNTNVAEGNAGNGFLVTGNSNNLQGNDSRENAGAGLKVSGTANHFNTNKPERNTGPEWVIGVGNLDDGGNNANGHRISFTIDGGIFE